MGFKQPWRIDERTSLLNLAPEHQRLVIQGAIGHSEVFEMSRVPAEMEKIVLRKLRAGEINTYNKLRAFVDGLPALEKQDSIFELQTLSKEERKTINDLLEAMVRQVERVLRAFHEENRLSHLSKTVFHSAVRVEQVDFIIQGLQKVRKSMLAGAKAALEAAA